MFHRDPHSQDLSGLNTPPRVTNPTLEAALAYLELGFSIVPIIGKKTGVKWTKYQTEPPSRAEVIGWFGGERPRFRNVAIVTGPVSGVVVVDCDSIEAAARCREAGGASPLAVRTGSGGLHYYHRYPPSTTVGNRVRLGGLALDIRGKGGYVVAPPSIHKSGRAYAWVPEAPNRLDDIPFFQPSLLEHFRSAPSQSATGIRDGGAYIRRIVAVAGQGGHNQTFRAACKLRDAGLTPEEALAELVVWNETNADPPWTTKELLHKVQSAFKQRPH